MLLEVHIRENGPASVVEFAGALDSSLPAETRRDIVSLIKPGCHVVFDLSGLDHLSGTGLRVLLLFIRAVQAVGGMVAGAGMPAVRRWRRQAGRAVRGAEHVLGAGRV
jgi:anti-anti-sigma factor